VPKRLFQLFVVAALILTIGAHWAVLQSIAWIGMTVSYSQHSTLSDALQKTFDGKHPCKLCKVVREGKKSERKNEMLKLETKFDFSFTLGAAWLYPPKPSPQFAALHASPLARLEAPLTPPPRSA
jgi:hypothetical protein